VRFDVTPAGERGRGKIGVMAASPETREPASVGDVIGALLVRPVQAVVETVRATFAFAKGTETGELMGPVGIVRETATANEQGRGAALLLCFLGLMFAMAWPVIAVVAIVVTPRRARA
jgi:hypothetical protein